jgi:hypothetical protein
MHAHSTAGVRPAPTKFGVVHLTVSCGGVVAQSKKSKSFVEKRASEIAVEFALKRSPAYEQRS